MSSIPAFSLKTTAGMPPNSVAGWLRELHRVNPVLSLTGWLHVALLLLALGLLPLDARLVTGALVWLKPLKFAVSVTAYVWTLGWLLADLPARVQRAVRGLSWGVAGSMVVEITCVFGQAARGTSSHYNQTSLFNGLVFGLMGFFILLNTLLTVWAVYLVWRHRPQGLAGYVWGVRLGLLVFLVGSVLGGVMIQLGQHTVGAPDGGPGLPGLGWSTRAGDLRAAHFLGLHALQIIPLLGWGLSRYQPRRAVLLTCLGALLYAGLVAGLFALALRGVPLIGE
ncbi:hypothetical protein [Hymenobacter rubripertinctus]|uniref:Uncharacterized protein n=1 Tax=Hymenobacter rubripertinctus TaxID=2029981 RepID=A0A418R073_9BACT|nr:hypothetical protein [Hymenobacter rubripertinctus]RIY10801.1 hypothetical protein D0T11_09060 [Hymenobacter rubripertinctus]